MKSPRRPRPFLPSFSPQQSADARMPTSERRSAARKPGRRWRRLSDMSEGEIPLNAIPPSVSCPASAGTRAPRAQRDMQLLAEQEDTMEFGNNAGGKLDVSDVELMEFLVGYNSESQSQQQPNNQQQQYQELSYSNNNTFAQSGIQQQEQQQPVANFNVTWTVQLASTASTNTADLADTDDERVVERWEPGEIISEEEEEDEDEGDEDSAKKRREDFLGRRTRNSIRRRRGRRRDRKNAQVRR